MLTTKVKLGIGTLFACLSVLLLSLVSPKASALYEDGDYLPYTPQQILNWADNRLYSNYGIHLSENWYIYKDTGYTGGRYSLNVICLRDTDTISFNANMPTSGSVQSSQKYYVAGCNTGVITPGSEPDLSTYSSGGVSNYSNDYVYAWPIMLSMLYTENVTFQFSDTSILPPEQFSDYLYILPKQLSGFEVYACVTENSRFSGWWAYTNKYILNVSGTYNSQPFTLTYPNYPAYFMTTRIEEYQWNVVDDEYTNIIIPDPYSTPSPFIQNIAYVPDITVEGISSPELDYSSSWVHTGYENAMSVGLNSLLNACKEYLNDDTLTDDFLWQSWTVSLVGYSDNRTYYSTVLDYSVVDAGTIPDPDPTDIDWYSSLDQILQTINNNHMYNYLNTPPIGYKKVGYVGQFGTLTTVTDPNFDFQPIDGLDTDAMGFFSWLVNLIVDSPVGVLMLFALTFLVVSAVIK